MNVLYLHQHFATRDGAGGTRSYEFARMLVQAGHTVTMVAAHREGGGVDRERRQHIDGIELISLGGFYANRLGAIRRAWQFARFAVRASMLRRLPHRPDVVVASSTPLTIGLPGVVLARRFGAPFVFEVRDLWPEAPIQMGFVRSPLLVQVLRLLEHWLYRRAGAVIALSPGMAAGVLAAGTDPARVVTIPNASDLDLFAPALRDRTLLEPFGIADRFVAVHAGSMGEANGLDYLLDTAASLQRRGEHDIAIAIAGRGGTRPHLERRVAREGLDNVVFLGSWPRRDLGPLVSSCDACLVIFADRPVLATNSPNKLFDGLAAGLPTIVNSPGWTCALITARDAGRHVDAARPVELADALVQLRDDPGLRGRQGANARALAETTFARARLGARFRLVLEHMAAAGRGNPGLPARLREPLVPGDTRPASHVDEPSPNAAAPARPDGPSA